MRSVISVIHKNFEEVSIKFMIWVFARGFQFIRGTSGVVNYVNSLTNA